MSALPLQADLQRAHPDRSGLCHNRTSPLSYQRAGAAEIIICVYLCRWRRKAARSAGESI
jgi:hypothetical protein